MSFNSRSMSHLLYRSRMIAFRSSTFCRLGLTPKACTSTVTYPFLFKRTSGVLNNGVPASLPCSRRDVHPLRVLLWSAMFAIWWRSPRPCVDCGKARSYFKLTTPAAAANYRLPWDQKLAPAKALVIVIQHIMVFARFLRATVVPPACTYALVPRLYLSKNRSPTRSLCYILIPAAPLNLPATFARRY